MAPRSVIDDDCGEGPRLYEAHGARSNEQRQAKLLRRRSENRYYMRDRFRGIRKPRLCTPDGAQLDIRGAIPGKFCLCRKKKCQQTQSQSQGQTPHCAGRKGMRHKRILPRLDALWAPSLERAVPHPELLTICQKPDVTKEEVTNRRESLSRLLRFWPPLAGSERRVSTR